MGVFGWLFKDIPTGRLYEGVMKGWGSALLLCRCRWRLWWRSCPVSWRRCWPSRALTSVWARGSWCVLPGPSSGRTASSLLMKPQPMWTQGQGTLHTLQIILHQCGNSLFHMQLVYCKLVLLSVGNLSWIRETATKTKSGTILKIAHAFNYQSSLMSSDQIIYSSGTDWSVVNENV